MKEKNYTRISIAYKNTILTLVCQIIQVLLGFIGRSVFIAQLGVYFLGYNAVFQNILQALNLADLGIGVAVTSFLYQPLANGDRSTINSLMYLYKKLYNAIGILVLVIGIVSSFFLQHLIPDATCSIWYLRVLFYINLCGTVSTYYLAYKRTLIIADQKSYVTTLVDSLAYFIMTVLQICFMFWIPSYVVYVVLNVAKNIISNLVISVRVKKIYGNLNDCVDHDIIRKIKPQIYTYIKDVFISRLGAYIYYSTDNIIISVFKGSLLTGYLSNYTLVTTQVSGIISQLLASVQATYGNYISTNPDKKLQQTMTENYLAVNYMLGNFCMLCVLFLIQPFVGLIFGPECVLNFSTAGLLAINLLFTIIIQIPSQIFMVYKLYRFDRPIIAISACLNIVISVSLVKSMGIDGVLIGTLITSMFYLFSRFYIVSRRLYNVKYMHYIRIFAKYTLYSILSSMVIYFITKDMVENTIATFAARMLIVIVCSITITILCLTFSVEYEFISMRLIPIWLRKYFAKKHIRLGGVAILCVGMFFGKIFT